jgi:hypothetical protein
LTTSWKGEGARTKQMVVIESQRRYKKMRKSKREPRWNLKPLKEDERRRKFTAAIDEKLELNPTKVE